MSCERLLLAAAAMLSLAACQHDPMTGRLDDTGWGEANRQTYAAQVKDPDPVYENPIPETSADHAVDAIDRYRTDRVKRPERIRTTTVGAAGAGTN